MPERDAQETYERGLGLIADQMEALHDQGRQTQEMLRQARDQLPAALAGALREVLTDPVTVGRVMDVVAETAQQRAALKAGRALGGAIKAVLTRWLLIGAIVVLVTKAAGVDVAMSVWKFLTSGTK